jgi:plasmid stability protein
MGSITIRKIDDAAKRNARLAAASKGRSLEAELRGLIEQTYGNNATDSHAARIKAMSGAEFVDHLIRVANGAALELPERAVSEDRDVFGAD